jgi:hypothetical protein
MKLMTKEIEQKLPPLYHFEKAKTEPVALVKFFDPTGSWTWYVAEGEKQDDGDWLFWGAVDGFEFEYGYFTLRELEHAKDGCKGIQALPIERDLYFKPVPLTQLSVRC